MNTYKNKLIVLILIFLSHSFCILTPRPSYIPVEGIDSNFIDKKINLILKADSIKLEVDNKELNLLVKHLGEKYYPAYDYIVIPNFEKTKRKFSLYSFSIKNVSDSVIILNCKIPNGIRKYYDLTTDYGKIKLSKRDITAIWCYRSKTKKIVGWSVYYTYQALMSGIIIGMIAMQLDK